jgi:hypothetical protein
VQTLRPIFRLKNLGDVKVVVIPIGRASTLLTRKPESQRDYVIQVGIKKKAAADSDGSIANTVPDEVLLLAEEIEALFLGLEDSDLNVWGIEAETEPILDGEDIERYMVAGAMVNITFRGHS